MSIITVSSQTVEEGTSVTFTFGPIQNGSSIIWKIEGNIQPADFTSLIGVEKITTGKFSRSFAPNLDFVDETSESFKVKIFTPSTTLAQVEAGGGTVLAESPLVSIVDLRQTAKASLSTTQTTFTEGGSVIIKLDVQNVPNNTALAYRIVGGPGISVSDFKERTSLDGQVVVSAGTFIKSPGTASLVLYPTPDFITEGNETFTVEFFRPGVTLQQVRAGGVTPWVTTPTITIADLFQTATVSIYGNTTSFMEGDVIQIRLATQNVLSKTSIYYQIVGDPNITLSDFRDRNSLDGYVGVEATGSVWPISGSALLQLLSARDSLTEGAESFRVRFYRPGVTKEQVTSGAVKDSWVETPALSLSDFSQTATVAISSTSATFTEGGKIDVVLNTKNVPNGTLIPWRIIGDPSVTAADFIGSSLSGMLSVNNSVASISFNLATDYINEGSERFKVCFYSPGTTATQALTATTTWAETPMMTVNDLVQTATVQALTKTSIQEGETLTFGVNTTNVADRTSLVWRIAGTVNAADFSNRFSNNTAMDGTVVIMRNTGSFQVATITDLIDEQPENFTVMLYRPGVTTQQALAGATPWVQWPQVTVSDAPKTISIVLAPTKAYAEGTAVLFTVYTTGIPDGTLLVGKLDGVGITTTDFYDASRLGVFTPITSLVYNLTISKGTTSFYVGLKKDGTREGPENFKLLVYRPGTTRQQAETGAVAPWTESASYTILDA